MASSVASDRRTVKNVWGAPRRSCTNRAWRRASWAISLAQRVLSRDARSNRRLPALQSLHGLARSVGHVPRIGALAIQQSQNRLVVGQGLRALAIALLQLREHEQIRVAVGGVVILRE